MTKTLLTLCCLAAMGAAQTRADAPAPPRAYAGLVSVGLAAGYHGWTESDSLPSRAWWDVNATVLEGLYFVTPRYGLGIRLLDGALCPVDTQAYAAPFAFLAPVFAVVTNHSARSFGYLSLQVMPYLPADLTHTSEVASSLALDYGFVPFIPWPVEGRVRVAGAVFDWVKGPFACQVSVGFRAGLGYWFMRRS